MRNVLAPFFILFLLILIPISADAQSNSTYAEQGPNHLDTLYQGIKWRCLGPYRGGRANAISGVTGDPWTYYAGYTGGGVWKTEDGGMNWKNLSDGYFTVGSIGDLAVSESDPNVIYVGTGEHAIRGVMTSFGNGVYKSTDAGKTWTHVGLEKTSQIANVVIHPDDPDIVYVAAQGAPNGPTGERGIYKSTDGGGTWKQTLFVNDTTGASSLVMDKTNPRILYAATWAHRRYPWKVISGGEGSAIWKSTDSGETWQKLTEGLPDAMGKIGVSVSPANPERVFAIIETEKSKSGLYRSDDAGMTWSHLSNDQLLTARSWYYMEVFADPNNENLVYVLNAPLMRSIDGGKTFENMRVIHGDTHGFWINPDDSDNFAMAEDGGATITFNAGKSWSTFNNQPTAQFYRITADRQVPFWVYGGQQDNFSVAIPTRSKNYGILSTDWFNGPGCETAMVAMDDPYNPRILYGGCYNGLIGLLDVETMERKDIRPYAELTLAKMPKDMKYRFNWNAPLINSPHDPKVMYYGGNVVFKTTNGGMSWEVISPDLTRNDTTKQMEGGGPFTNEGAGGENYNTIYYLAESPHEEGVIYAASDCGLIHITKDGGENWQDITPAGMPESMIHSIEVSPHDPGTVYFASTRYKFNDRKNYSYKSANYGSSWTRIGDDIQAEDFFKVIREDPKVPGILYAGAERGFYISFDGGGTFERFQRNLPVVPVTDLVIRHNSLVAATAGRSFWMIDDLSAIQQSRGETPDAEVVLFEPVETPRLFGAGQFFLITEHGFGENPPEGVHLDYYVDADDSTELILEILNSDGEVIRTIEGTRDQKPSKPMGSRGNIIAKQPDKLPMHHGVNRFTWDLRTDTLVKVPDVFIFAADYRGHRVAPGTYTARLKYGDQVSEAPVVIKDPPGLEVPDEVWAEQQEKMRSIEQKINDMHTAINTTIELRDRLQTISEQLEGKEEYADVKAEADSLDQKLKEWQSVVIEFRQKGFQDVINWSSGLNSEYFILRGSMDSYDPAIPEGIETRYEDLNDKWADHNKAYQAIMVNDVARFNTMYANKSLPALPKTDRVDP